MRTTSSVRAVQFWTFLELSLIHIYFAVVECIVFLMAVIFVVINFIVDVLYCVINPRVRLQ